MDEMLIEHWFNIPLGRHTREIDLSRIRMGALAFARIINDIAPDCADKTVALRRLREAVHSATDAIVLHEGKHDIRNPSA